MLNFTGRKIAGALAAVALLFSMMGSPAPEADDLASEAIQAKKVSNQSLPDIGTLEEENLKLAAMEQKLIEELARRLETVPTAAAPLPDQHPLVEEMRASLITPVAAESAAEEIEINLSAVPASAAAPEQVPAPASNQERSELEPVQEEQPEPQTRIEPVGSAGSAAVAALDNQDRRLDRRFAEVDQVLGELRSDNQATRRLLHQLRNEMKSLRRAVESSRTKSRVHGSPTKDLAQKDYFDVAIGRSSFSSSAPLATVVVDRTAMRTGPGYRNVKITSLARGTRVPVRYARGSWVRVVAPNGVDAWVPADTLAFVR